MGPGGVDERMGIVLVRADQGCEGGCGREGEAQSEEQDDLPRHWSMWGVPLDHWVKVLRPSRVSLIHE